MKNNKLQKLFFRTFLVTVIAIILAVGIGFTTYAIIGKFFEESDVDQNQGVEKSMSIIANVNLGTPALEVIYDADENDSEIKHIVLGVFNTQTHNLDYMTIPATTQYKMSDDLFEELSSVNEDLPQTVKFSELPKYFPGKEVYEYGELLLGDMLGVDMSFYTKITSTDFENYFKETQMSFYSPKKATFEDTLVYSDAFIKSYENVKPETVINFLTDINNSTASNLSLTDRTKYASDFAQVAGDKVYFWHAYGDYKDNGDTFNIDVKSTKKVFDTIIDNASYTVTQSEYMETQKKASSVSSKKLKIQILNGSGVKGLAGKWSEKLVDEGYKVGGVSDYKDDNLTHTKIIVKKESVGLDLIKYFKNAQTEVGNVTDGYDIVIAVGLEDNLE